MIKGATYAHTNLIARDWRVLSSFYQTLFGCVPIGPERDYRGAALEAGTAIVGAQLQGVHLALPGFGEQGPTLEIFQYEPALDALPVAVNRPGFGHIAFGVDDVSEARAQVLAHGGRAVGEIVTSVTATGDQVMWTYVTDPEGNVIELQSWIRDTE